MSDDKPVPRLFASPDDLILVGDYTAPLEIRREGVQVPGVPGVSVDFVAALDPVELRYQLTELAVHAPGVTGALLRQIPVQALLQAALQESVRDWLGAGANHPVLVDQDTALALASAGPTPETLRAAALVYVVTSLSGGSPTKAVRDTFGLPPRTASHWVKLARERGHIPEQFGDPTGTAGRGTDGIDQAAL